MARNVVTDKDLGLNNILKEVQSLRGNTIKVGIQQGTGAFYRNISNKKDATVAQYAFYNEFGTEKIPQRSFMRTAFDENLNKIELAIESEYQKVLSGSMSADIMLGRIGLLMTNFVQRKIRSIFSPPNSPITIVKKKSSKPLIDTGRMINSVRHVIQKGRS